MLNNPNWDKPAPKPGTWASVIAWLETKDPTGTYEYGDSWDCLAAQYNDSISRIYEVPVPIFHLLPWRWRNFDQRLESIASYMPYTFGAALARAKDKQ